MSTGAKDHGPTRIELASSELGGGSIMAWVDPQQVLACVAQVDSRESFSRFLEPRLADIDNPPGGEMGEGASNLPHRVRRLLDRLRQAHTRLYQDNRAVQGPGRLIRPVLLSLEEGTVYFIKAAPCWVFRVRDDASELIRSGGEPSADSPGSDGLGQTTRLNLAVSSVDVRSKDIVVLLVAEGGAGPDRLAVSAVFKENQDLKRACDGLVDLFGLTCSGVGAVAMRFVPVGMRERGTENGISLVEDLEREMAGELEASGAMAASGHADEPNRAAPSAPAEGLDEFLLPPFLEQAGKPYGSPQPVESAPAPDAAERPAAEMVSGERSGTDVEPAERWVASLEPAERSPASVESAGQSATRVDSGEGPAMGVAPATLGSEPAAVEACAAASVAAPSAPCDEGGSSRGRGSGGSSRRVKGMSRWALAFTAVLATLIAVIAVPRGVRLLHGGGSLAEGGVLRIDPTPPARAILIDGIDQDTGSPAILEGVAPGPHRVLLDLGAFGSMEVKVRMRTGETVDLRPRASGSLEITVVDPRPGAVVWLPGGQRMVLPCRIDSLPAGWQEVLYEDDRLPLWQRQVLILAGETARVRINNSFALDQALLRVESWAYRQGEGLHASEGDTVFVDRRFFGVTPLEREVQPGLHGVRVVGRGGACWSEVLNLTAGSSRVVAPRFGLEPWPQIEHQEPGRVLLRGPVLLTATFTSPEGELPRNPRLHLPDLDATVRDIPLSPVDPEKGVYVGIVQPRWIPLNEAVEYYFTVQTSDGQTLSSELYRLTAVSEISLAFPR